jgi:hypothetical protein
MSYRNVLRSRLRLPIDGSGRQAMKMHRGCRAATNGASVEPQTNMQPLERTLPAAAL